MLQRQLMNTLMFKIFANRLPRFQFFYQKHQLILQFLKLQFANLDRGKKNKELESMICQQFNSNHCLTTSSFRMGWYFALKSLGLKEGDEILLTPITIPETINAILMLKLKPVFIEISLDDHSVEIDLLDEKITNRSKVLLVTYLSGIVPNMGRILDFTKKNNLIFIEDFSQNYESHFEGKYLGTWGDVGIGSLSSGKILSAPVGGIILTQSNIFAEKISNEIESFIQAPNRNVLSYYLKNCLTVEFATSRPIYIFLTHYYLKLIAFFSKKNIADFEHEPDHKYNIFYTYKPKLRNEFPTSFFTWLSDWQSELALGLLANIRLNTNKRRKLAKVLCENLSSNSLKLLPKNLLNYDQNSFYHFPIYCFGKKDKMREFLSKKGIDNGSYGLNLCTKEEIFFEYSVHLPHSEQVKYDSIFLPIHEKYTEEHMVYIANCINQFLES